ncbi:glutamine amidotransferase [Marichromatium purpuratum 984]|uniref:Glutamine amidotransferase n=1 Tax=Marichromatium purpuratum 984 TaxID=765910 RepID=W0E0E1_MARPU|nr:glutamine amidotransferase [Marichromatium purpuratum]AHF04340.1 glutamine amidotransferase [Marichromatium purpuratum 984]
MQGRRCIIKVGGSFGALTACRGDFEDWIRAGLGADGRRWQVIDASAGEALPDGAELAGVVITGSHAMVTEAAPWSLSVEQWLAGLLARRVPVLGICYGHQLLARACGGEVGFNPRGLELGCVEIRLTAVARDDPLFGGLPGRFVAPLTHAQSVLRPPPEAQVLAANDHDPHQALRLGETAWGVQFHPEFDREVTQVYVDRQIDKLGARGAEVEVVDTPEAAGLLQRFAALVSGR